jgi:hypothetical protein
MQQFALSSNVATYFGADELRVWQMAITQIQSQIDWITINKQTIVQWLQSHFSSTIVDSN